MTICDNDDYDQVGKVTALAFLLNGSETELFLCEEGAVKITLARFNPHHHSLLIKGSIRTKLARIFNIYYQLRQWLFS